MASRPGQPLERQPDVHGHGRGHELARGDPGVVGHEALALECRLERRLPARVDLREALAQLGVADDVGPELEEDGQPAVVATTPGGALGRPLLDRRHRAAAVQQLLGGLDGGVGAALIDREEQVLLGREVGVDRALRVAGLGRDGVDRGGVEAVRGEQPAGGFDEILAGPLAALLPRHACDCHTVGILIPLVSECQPGLVSTVGQGSARGSGASTTNSGVGPRVIWRFHTEPAAPTPTSSCSKSA